MADLEFVERVARWLTNTQVQIKSEVASSNSQFQTIDESLDKLECIVQCCENSPPTSNEVCMLIVMIIFISTNQDTNTNQIKTKKTITERTENT